MNGNKKGGLFAGVLVGLLMVIIGTVMLWWNEGNNVRNIKTTDEIEKTVVEINPNDNPADYEGKLVAVGGKFTVEDVSLSDTTFGVEQHTAALSRVVEIYQWEEESHSDDDGTTYTYKKVWHEGLIDSSDYHRSGYDNPTSVAYESESVFAEDVILGKFHLSSTQIKQMDAEKSIAASEAKKVPEKYSVIGNYVTNSADLDNPQIGDVRISWKYNDWKEVSVISQVAGTTFVGWTSAVGKKVNWVTDLHQPAHQAGRIYPDSRPCGQLHVRSDDLPAVACSVAAGYHYCLVPLPSLAEYRIAWHCCCLCCAVLHAQKEAGCKCAAGYPGGISCPVHM